MKLYRLTVFFYSFLVSFSSAQADTQTLSSTIQNHNAYIPPQCYTKITKTIDHIPNPCYTCHTKGQKHNYVDDSDLQLDYNFAATARKNPYTNLFRPWRDTIKDISNEEILRYINEDNYRSGSTILLTQKLNQLPKAWDNDNDGIWNGYKPDAYYSFDDMGFDLQPDGTYTGWRSIAYYPFPGTFWPTNGSVGDVLIRLPKIFQQTAEHKFDITTYRANLAILKARFLMEDVHIAPINEHTVSTDLNRDGKMNTATTIKYHKTLCFVGLAQPKYCSIKSDTHALLPVGTEFLHSLRYLAADGKPAPRMKELRYAKKYMWLSPSQLWQIASREVREKELIPNGSKFGQGDFERGMMTLGWKYQGFIEDNNGQLRPQDQEESLFCIGCHGGIGASTDTIFSLGRSINTLNAPQKAWYHNTQYSLKNIPDRQILLGSSIQGEYFTYLKLNQAADEFHDNDEAKTKFFVNGKLSNSTSSRLSIDISFLLYPSNKRAMMLNKAYKVIVQEQSYKRGRTIVFDSKPNIHKLLRSGEKTGIKKIRVVSSASSRPLP